MTLLPLILPTDGEYEARIARLVHRSAVIPDNADQAARAIVEDVRRRGDAAVREHTERLEKRRLVALEIDRTRWDDQAAKVAPDVAKALERAASRIRLFHGRQRDGLLDGYTVDEGGVRLELRVSAVDRAGLYVPGGKARYPSSVLMTAVPASVAGVREIIMVTPGASPETLLAARIAGVSRVFEIGGAQAVAALAYGTESVPRVDKIVGPGNIYVAAAKRIVFGDVDIDSVAGPSEVLCLADESASPRLVASDLLAQAEHDADAIPILVATSETVAVKIRDEVTRQLADLPRRATAEKALLRNGAAIVAVDLPAAIALANRFAPEHIGIHVRNARHVATHIITAGAVFVGPLSPEAAGDYLAGPNHVLPTGGSARFGSPLGVYDFVRRSSVIEYTADGLRAQAADISRLARVEGLDAHARSVAIRLEALATARAAGGGEEPE